MARRGGGSVQACLLREEVGRLTDLLWLIPGFLRVTPKQFQNASSSLEMLKTERNKRSN